MSKKYIELCQASISEAIHSIEESINTLKECIEDVGGFNPDQIVLKRLESKRSTLMSKLQNYSE